MYTQGLAYLSINSRNKHLQLSVLDFRKCRWTHVIIYSDSQRGVFIYYSDYGIITSNYQASLLIVNKMHKLIP